MISNEREFINTNNNLFSFFNMYIVLFIPIYKDYNQNPELNVLVISAAMSSLAGLADVSTARC